MFKRYDIAHGLLDALEGIDLPGRVHAWKNAQLNLQEGSTHFGFVFDQEAQISCRSGQFTLVPGMFFSIVGEGWVESRGSGLVISRLGYRGAFSIGGPIEPFGRLRYINGCSDSLLLSPVTKGDPCLNLLHIPRGTHQSQHTHPSYRIGMIVKGTGACVTPEERIELAPGLAFMIPKDTQHSFHTETEDLTVIAYHPDSDCGPTDHNHPMINRTILNRNVEALPEERNQV